MRVFINGIGAVSETACTSADFAELAGKKDLTAKGQKIEFTSTVPSSKLRRASRYAKLTVSAADLALADSNTEINDPYRIGAVMAWALVLSSISGSFPSRCKREIHSFAALRCFLKVLPTPLSETCA